MEDRSFESNTFQRDQSMTGFTIDFKRIAYQALRNWYWIFLSLAVFTSIAFLRNRYATRIYPVSASIIIKEREETGGAELLYKNALIDPYRNYLNELYIIKSYPLIQRVLEDLNFGISFFIEGNFLTTEAYGELPFSARVINSSGIAGRKFHFVILNEKQFQLFPNGDDESQTHERTTFSFGDTIVYQGLQLVFLRDERRKQMVDKPFIFLYQSPASITGGYVGKLSVAWAEEGAGVINLSINGPNSIKDLDFINGLIRRYQQYDLDKKNETASRTIEFIDQQLVDISDSLQRVEIIIEKFRGKNTVVDASEETTRLFEKLEGLDVQNTDFLVHKNYYEYLTSYLKQSDNRDVVIAPSSVGITDPVLSALIAKMIDIQVDLKLIAGSEKLKNPLVVERINRLAEIKKNVLEAVNNIQATESIRQNYLLKQIAATEGQMRDLPESERRYISIKRKYSLLENLYVFLLQKKSEASISRASSTTDIIVVNPPMVSGGAIAPKSRQNYILAILIGLGVPFGLFVLLEAFNSKIQSREDIAKVTDIPFIGGIGHKRLDSNLEVLETPKSAVAESFRALRSNLNYFMDGKSKGVFLITSSISGEGKSFASINLASVFALSGKKTLIIGADMRKPRIYNDFRLSNTQGLSSFLANIDGFDEIIQRTQFENLDMVSGGPVPPNPSELLLTEKMNEFISRAKAAYDYVIIDTPPMALVTDAFTLSRYADHTLFLVRQNYTPKPLLRTAQDFYSSGKLKNISIVFNDIFRSGPGYGYGYGYGYSYGYGYGYGYGRSKNGYGYYSES